MVYEYGQDWNVPAAPQKNEMAPKINPITNYQIPFLAVKKKQGSEKQQRQSTRTSKRQLSPESVRLSTSSFRARERTKAVISDLDTMQKQREIL